MGFLIFFTVEFSLFFLSTLIRFRNKKEKNIFAIMMFIFMFFFSALRGTGDGDYYNYLVFSKNINEFKDIFNFNYPVEIGFRITAFIVHLFNGSNQRTIATMNFLSIIPTTYVVLKKSYDPIMSAIIFLPFFLQFDMQTSRTATAMGMGILAIYFNSEKKYLKSFFSFLVSVSFHSAAVVVLPFLFLMHINISRIFKGISSIFAFFLSLKSSLIIDIAVKMFLLLGFDFFANKLFRYTYGEQFAYPMKIYDPRIIMILALFITTLMYFSKDDIKKLSFEDASVKSIRVAFIIFMIFRFSTLVSFRLSSFFSIMEIFYIPFVIEKIKKIDEKGAFFIKLSIVLFILPYAIFLVSKYPAYKIFLYSNKAKLFL